MIEGRIQYWRADLGRDPRFLVIGSRDLKAEEYDSIQPDGRWSLYIYLHEGTVTINQRTYAYRPGIASIVPPSARLSHLGRLDRESSLVVHVGFDLPSTQGDIVALPAISEIANFDVTMEALNVAVNYVVTSNTRVHAVIWNLLWSLSLPSSYLRQNELLYAAEDWIQRALGRQFEVGELASALDVSHETLRRVFRLEHGMTVQEYARWQRIQVAKRLLVQTSLPVKAVGARVGIPDLQHFNKLLRAYTGLSPRRFREEHS